MNLETMLKIDQLIEESRSSSQLIGALTGLGGYATGGNINGLYNKHKQSLADTDVQQLTGEPGSLTQNDNMLGKVGHTLAGAIPIVGSVTNVMAANRRWDALDKLNAERAKKNLPALD